VSILALGVVCAVSLVLVPLGLPGTWLMLAAGFAYNWLVPLEPIGWFAFGAAIVLTLLAEFFEFALAGRYARKYGGSRRAGWGALAGSVAGALLGVPIPIFGSLLGAFAGAFIGALLAEYTHSASTARSATRVATGALLGRVAAAAMKTALGAVIAVVLVFGAVAASGRV
jgi:uncharacterized protein YqgC (DUF456 family)